MWTTCAQDVDKLGGEILKETIYRLARMHAAKKDPCLSNRERAAMRVFCSAEALADYENGVTIPPCAVVQAMVEAYGMPDLRGQHIRACCPLMDEGYGSEEASQLAQAALGWAVAFGSVQDVVQKFALIARDGHISPGEEISAQLIRAKAIEIMKVMQETIDVIDRTMLEGESAT